MAQDVTSKPNPVGTLNPALAAVLACPACSEPLVELRCAKCRQQYPQLGSLPWLLADPVAQIHEWRNRWHLALRQLQAQEQACVAALTHSSSELTRARLQQLRDAYAGHRQAVQTLLQPLEVGVAGTRETYLALQTALPQQHRLFSYTANLFRDWSWGEVENRGALAAINSALAETSWQASSDLTILVLGSGGGRLAYDLHTQWRPALTLGLEINPYLALAAAQICQGHALALYEFPLAPRSSSDVALLRTLVKPEQRLPPGLAFAVADALAPPLQMEQFDLVVTPWFADVCGAPVPALAALVNSLLRDGGFWINQGALAFNNGDPVACLSPEEFTEQVCNEGFARGSSLDCTLPYLQSPNSRHGRVEQVNTSCFHKCTGATTPRIRPESDPSWLLDLRAPVPALPAFRTQTQTTAVHAFLMSMIDGKRSVVEMAAIMAARGMLEEADAQQALRGFFSKMHDEATSYTGL